MVLTSFGLCLEAYGNTSLEETNMSYGISMTTDKIMYSIGEPIIMTVKIFNYTKEDIAFHFNTSQRYDFIIEDEKGNEIWRWSKDKMFAMVLGEEILGPINTEIIYTAECKSKLSSDYYKVTGIFIAKDRQMSVCIIIEVK
ncbi:MAG: hypothetical protein HWN79_17580 [Candidatus Lokiarchaeota archaeon]|nr:hypothetical protein [Candidatus Lokiarchaeota archaeon]